MLDGTIKLEVKLTGFLNTHVLSDNEEAGPWVTCVYPDVLAHNHRPYLGKPASYKLIFSQCPPLLAKPVSLVDKRASWASTPVQVVPYREDRLYPSGVHVPQYSGDGVRGMHEGTADSNANIQNTDVFYFPLIPVEPISLLLKPKHFFTENPALDIVPSYACTTGEAKAAAANGGIVVKSRTGTTFTLTFERIYGFIGECCK
ncbi:hypothetical protein BABINDRAFT_7029 [Babjeviella inositovora NRRL Y-12698]|uniref:Amine oxidase n=1 Tax=Babjeviella inositovora NRRL Y-12698 TaxID=984486 RepID=A0A1E3QU57_9ASCO|nr:uncharacterized protein BABINDRAFT_7029 [Babjeviella inositovora NRRL Y-12698]ODQ81206.1 hypothetical protein BABINDRAFT_7029 [Babjeviella inositovora NRRL Y-12698]